MGVLLGDFSQASCKVGPCFATIFTSHMVEQAPDLTSLGQRVKELRVMPKPKFNVPTVEEMLSAGVHFGHRVKRWNPFMEKYIYSTDDKTHVIDVYQTQELLEKACEALYEIAKSGKQIVLVGTKRQAADIIEKAGIKSGALYVTQRWLGGTFTNFESVKGNWKELLRLKEGREKNKFSHFTKKERLLIDRKIEKLNLFVGGITNMKRYPGAVVVIDVKREKTAVKEAQLSKIPIIGVVDTNSDPRNVDYVIPANDDAIKSITLLIGPLVEAIELGYKDAGKDDGEVQEKVPEPKENVEKKPVKTSVTKKKKTSTKKAPLSALTEFPFLYTTSNWTVYRPSGAITSEAYCIPPSHARLDGSEPVPSATCITFPLASVYEAFQLSTLS